MVVLCLVYSRPVRPESRPRRLRHCHFVVSDEEDATGKVVVRTRLTRTLSTPKRCSTCNKMVYFTGIRCKQCGALSHESCANHSPHWCSPATVVDLGRRSGAGNHQTLDAAEDRCGEQEWRFSSVGHEVLTVSPLMDQPFLFSSTGDHGTSASASQLQPALPAPPPPPRSPTLAVTGLLKVVHWLSQRRKSARPDAVKQLGRSRLADERLARKKLKVLSSHQPAAATPPCTCHTRKASFAAGILSPNGSLSSSGYISSSASSAVQTPSDTELDCRGARAHEPCRLHPTRGAGLVRQNAVISEHGRSGRQWLANKARTLSLETKANDVEKLCATWPPLGRSAGNPAENFLEEPESGIEESEQEDKSKSQSTNIKDTLGEWCVPYKDVEFKERLRQGRDTDVYRGRWHGEVLIYTFRHTKEQDVTKFWDEVGKLSMIRHENIALFMGACAEPPQYAIITSMKKGPSLFEHIHIKKHHLSFHTKVNIARQIVQGMGYLHAKGIVHKSLTSKNVVLESRVKLCLMDQGLAERVHDPSDRGCLARGHLTYLAPELMRQLRVEPPNVFSDCEPSQESDLYAFGTILYELIAEAFPFGFQHPHSVIWQIASGQQQPLNHLQCTGSFKTLIHECWFKAPEARPSFVMIGRQLQENVTLHRKHSSSEPDRLHHSGLGIGRQPLCS
ncbi:uncharacterized protein LOC119186509 isoform X3 [Rhipicephalus microplus]